MSSEDDRGRKGSKQRVSILTTANSTGTEKLNVLLIDRAKLSRSFRGMKTLSVGDEHNSKAWMLSGEWERFLKQWNAKLATQGRHILLLADKMPCHSKIPLSNMKLIFSPLRIRHA